MKHLSRLFGGGKPQQKQATEAPDEQRLDPLVIEMADLISKLGHELRSPLSAIIGYSELLTDQAKNGAFSVKAGDQVQKISSAGNYIERTIASATAISALLSGRVAANRSRFELTEFLDGIEQTGKLLAAKNNNSFVLNASAVENWIEADQERLQDVIRELISNACKFTANGTVTLSVSITEGVMTATIVDTGIGITEADLPRVFDRFVKIDSKNKGLFSASTPGLGLALVQETLNMLGGSISVTSAFGSGTTFEFDIPV